MKNLATIAVIATACLLPFTGCTDTQNAQYQKTKAAITAALSTPQAKALESFGATIATAALSVYAPAFAWTLPLALNTASGLLADKNLDESVATIQQTVKSVSGVPAYHNVAVDIGNAIAAVHPVDEAQRMAAAQALAMSIAEHLPKSK